MAASLTLLGGKIKAQYAAAPTFFAVGEGAATPSSPDIPENFTCYVSSA
ncbi:MAG: hypothetical protein AAB354_09055 [candidate division KSB1 bacterium]